MAVVGILLLNSLKEKAFFSPPSVSLLALPLLWAWHMALHMVETQTGFARSRGTAAGDKTQRGRVTGSRWHREHQRKIKGQALELSLGTPFASRPRCGFLGSSWQQVRQWCQIGVIQQLGGTAGPGDPRKPSAGAESRSQSGWGLSCWS